MTIKGNFATFPFQCNRLTANLVPFFSFEKVPVKYNVNLTGIPNRSESVSAIMPYTYTANDVAMAAEGVHEVSVFQRNENISLSIVGDTPLPVSLLGMTWEGKYNNKFYSHV